MKTNRRMPSACFPISTGQYGQYPIFKGPYYNAPVIDSKDGNPVYRKNRETGRYEIIDPRRGTHAVYDPRFVTLFPRILLTGKPHSTIQELRVLLRACPSK
jgi:hypothetical protein